MNKKAAIELPKWWRNRNGVWFLRGKRSVALVYKAKSGGVHAEVVVDILRTSQRRIVLEGAKTLCEAKVAVSELVPVIWAWEKQGAPLIPELEGLRKAAKP